MRVNIKQIALLVTVRNFCQEISLSQKNRNSFDSNTKKYDYLEFYIFAKIC